MQVPRPPPLSLCESRGTLTDIVVPLPAMREIFVLSVSGCVSDRASRCVRGHEAADGSLNHTRGGEARTYHRRQPGGPPARHSERPRTRRRTRRRDAGPPRFSRLPEKLGQARAQGPLRPLGPSTESPARTVPPKDTVSPASTVSPKDTVSPKSTVFPKSTVSQEAAATSVRFTAPAMRHM
jgi:hypothetical protein